MDVCKNGEMPRDECVNHGDGERPGNGCLYNGRCQSLTVCKMGDAQVMAVCKMGSGQVMAVF